MNKLVRNSTILAVVITTTLLISTSINAEERQGLLLNAAIAGQYDDNVLRKIDPISDSSLQFSPELQYLTHLGKHIFSMQYQGEYAAYKENNKLNYNNHDIALFARLDHSLKINSAFKLSYKDEIEEPGSNNSSSLFIRQFNQTKIKQATAKFYYGSKQSIGQLVLGLDHRENRYTNNLQGYRDVDRNSITGTFFYRIAPKTRLLFQASMGNYNYIIKSQFPDQSSKENFYLAGIEWDITAKTSGTFKLGYQGKNFEQKVYNDISGLSYMLDMTWKPNTYSTIEIGASRMTRESSQRLTSAFVTNSYTANAEHEITPRTKLKASYTVDSDDIVSIRSRTDKRHKLVLGVEHSLLTWLNIGIDYQFIERNSDLEIYNYKTTSIGLSLTTRFK
ncbi:outer membrane beta-barrel protein [Colwellia sp. TT2012]|uniref:outer membrane beta-barrel protein n=1 Tax=Colwellia sp. TT2012 TaxID=1720342 RepID=UPI0018D1FD7E|nr:outer membrane beta-barrel protein [Colwellia sp. TT2012]